jgi:hypothetical protein
MNLTEIYINVFFENFFKELQEEFIINEDDTNTESLMALKELLNTADEIVFKKFGINPKDKVYFIAGSAALYLYPRIRDLFNLKRSIGDLDVVVPDPKYWKNAGLEGQTIYRPQNNDKIEVFSKWDPAKAGDEYADTTVADTQTILNRAFQKNGYWFMNIIDVLDYKTKLSRPEKEKEVLNAIDDYLLGKIKTKLDFITQLKSLGKLKMMNIPQT